MPIRVKDDSYRVYWEDKGGNKNSIFTEGKSIGSVVNETEEYIRERLYMDSFTIVEVEKWIVKGWETVDTTVRRCKARA